VHSPDDSTAMLGITLTSFESQNQDSALSDCGLLPNIVVAWNVRWLDMKKNVVMKELLNFFFFALEVSTVRGYP
jgi:hypothetical protein